MPKDSLRGKKSNAMNNAITQIKRMAKKGKMPTSISGTAADQIKVYEAIEDAFPSSQAMRTFLQKSTVQDQTDLSSWRIQAPDGTVSIMMYPQGATDKAKQGALKMFAWNETKDTQPKVSAKRGTTKMPWETDPKYSGNKNGKLLWLMDHPQSKYNDPGFISGIKRIESMSDNGVSAAQRKKAFASLCKAHKMTVAEGKHFIAPEFLR